METSPAHIAGGPKAASAAKARPAREEPSKDGADAAAFEAAVQQADGKHAGKGDADRSKVSAAAARQAPGEPSTVNDAAARKGTQAAPGADGHAAPASAAPSKTARHGETAASSGPAFAQATDKVAGEAGDAASARADGTAESAESASARGGGTAEGDASVAAGPRTGRPEARGATAAETAKAEGRDAAAISPVHSDAARKGAGRSSPAEHAAAGQSAPGNAHAAGRNASDDTGSRMVAPLQGGGAEDAPKRRSRLQAADRRAQTHASSGSAAPQTGPTQTEAVKLPPQGGAGPNKSSAVDKALAATSRDTRKVPGLDGSRDGDLSVSVAADRPGRDTPTAPTAVFRAEAGAGAGTPRLDLAKAVAHQLADGAQRFADKPVELALDPPELGRVRLSLASGDGSMTVQVTADRHDTLHLMRRHIDTLAQDFHDLGYGEVSFSFSGGSTGEDSGRQGGPFLAAPEEAPAVGGADAPVTRLVLTPDARLDIRL